MSSGTEAFQEDSADRIYFAYLQRGPDDGLEDIEVLCTKFPNHADRLRALHSQQPTVFRPNSDTPRTPIASGQSQDGAGVPDPAGAPRYPIRGQLGRGGMGIVYRVWDERLHRELALKQIRVKSTTEAEAQRTLAALRPRFVREAELTAQLDHPGVVPIHEIGTDSNGLVYFTMRLVDGTRLDTLFEQFQERDPVWTRSRILDVIVKICETLAYAHSKGIIHRDLKPENIMVGRFGETYVMDWGLAKCLRAATRADAAEPEAAAAGATSNSQASATSVVSEAEFDTDTLAGSVLGTAAFMPPEQATGRIREVDERSDIYAVGGMLYQLLTRRRPYTTDPPLRPEDIVKAVTMGPPASIISLNPRAQPELMAICEKAMARDKALRYETMQAMADDLRAYLENRVVKAHRTGAGAELRKWVSRNVGVAVTSALALLTALVGLGAIVVLQSVANEKLKSSNDTVSAQRDELEKTNETVSAQRDELVNAYREKDEAFENEQIARKLAEDERTKTEAIALARESASALSSNPGQALRLALESTSRSATLPGATAAWSAIQDCREIRTLRVHRSEVRALAVSPTGEHFATASTDSVVVIWDGKTLAPRFLLSGSHVLTPILQFSPDGAVLAVTDSDGVVSLWNPRTGRLFGELPTGENRHVVCLCFSPDGTRLACGTTNGRIQIWSVQQMVELATHKRHTDGIQVAAFSPDGRVLVTGGRDGQLMIWDAQTGDLLQQVTAHVTGVGFLEFSPDGKQLVSGPLVDDLEGAASGADARPEPREARLWNTADFALVKDIPHGAVTTSAAFSSDGLHLFTAGVDGALCTWQLPGLARIDRGVVAKGPIKSLKIGADGRYVTTLRNDATVAVIDRRRGREFSFQRHDAPLRSGAFLRSDQFLTIAVERTVRVWNLRMTGDPDLPPLDLPPTPQVQISPDQTRGLIYRGTTRQLCRFPEGDPIAVLQRDAAIYQPRFSPEGGLIAALDLGGGAGCWSSVDGRLLNTLPGDADIAEFRFIDETRIAARTRGGGGPRVVVWSPRNGQVDRQPNLQGHDHYRLSDDGQVAWGWSRNDNTVKAFQTTNGTLLGSTTIPPETFLEIPRLELGRTGRTLVHSRSGAASLFNISTGQFVLDIDDKVREDRTIVFSHDDRWVYTGGFSAECHQYDALTGQLKQVFSGHEASVARIIPSRDGRRLIIGDHDGAARLWDAASAASITLLGNPIDAIKVADFTPDSTRFATVTSSGLEVTLWDSTSGIPVAKLQVTGPPVGDLRFSPDGKWLATGHIDGTARFWPLVGTEAVTNTLAVGQLNPDDLDRFDLGREPERKAFHRSWDHRHLVNWLDLASRAQPRRKLAQGRHTDVIWNAVVGYTESLRKDLQPQEVIAELEQIAGELADRGDVSSQVLAALAGGFRRCGDFRTAQRLIQQVLERRDFSTPQLMADWAVLGLGPLGQTPTELLRQWVRIDQPAADDVRWLLDRLAAGEPIRINAGGENYDAADGAHWRHDCFFRGGYRFGETLGQPPIADVVIADTPHPPLYQTERWFDVGGSAEERGYHIPVPPGRYRVVIHFAEIWHMAPEFRTVAVVAEGHDGGCRFDSEQTGFARPATCELVAEVDDGELNLEFKSIRRSPKVSAFEIFRLKD